MKRYQIRENLIMGYINVPDDIDESNIFTYMDRHNCWPDADEVVDHEAILCDLPDGTKEMQNG